MNIKCCDFKKFAQEVSEKNSRIVMFGAGAVGSVISPQLLYFIGIFTHIDCYIDNNNSKWDTCIELYGRHIPVKSPAYLKKCDHNTVILINISRYVDAYRQLEDMECTQNMSAYIMPMLLIHNFCTSVSKGKAQLCGEPCIPKKIHYMWLGRKPIPDKLKRCIESWKKFCPDYEIIEWNEDNYDIEKNLYMKQAYEYGAYGFVPDYARLDILFNEGGFYLDTDVELKRSIETLRYQRAFCGVEKWQIINFGGLSGAIKGHKMIGEFLSARSMLKYVQADGRQNRNTCGYYDTQIALKQGYKPDGTTQTINDMNIYAYDYFHPYDYMSGTVNETEHTYSIHWFNGGWLDEKMKMANEEARQKYMDLYYKALAL